MIEREYSPFRLRKLGIVSKTAAFPDSKILLIDHVEWAHAHSDEKRERVAISD